GSVVRLWSCTGGGGQNWAVGGNGSLVNGQSGKCLDADGGGSADGTRLIVWTCHGGANQRWTPP
ncbi:RICIN domain-containing protein, partial [Saccharothrix coeruleofusca]|uniref:RICIN domain-containing protein n=1 Tax=Saccharothrix coeruleofusca TaxID=33919 RepID=UPI00166FC3A1